VLATTDSPDGAELTSQALTPLTELERDALGELSNLAMARAATSLRKMVKNEVRLSVPKVEILTPAKAAEAIAKPNTDHLVAVRQDFDGPFSGRALLIFPEAKSLELVRVIVGRDLPIQDIVELEDEALAETGNIILNSWIATIANLLKQELKMSLPVVMRRNPHQIFEEVGSQKLLILFIHISFEISHQQIEGYVALMMDIPSIEELRALVAEYVISITRGNT
jgi:chemotaxis protein CheC